MWISTTELSALAALAAKVPVERRRLLQKQLPLGCGLKYDAGVVAGLVRASEIVAEQQGEAAAQPLREIAAVAAAVSLHYQREYERIREQENTPEFRAEIEAECERIRTGQVVGIPLEEVICEMEAMVAASKQDKSKGKSEL